MDMNKLSPAPWHTGGTTYTPSGPKMNVWTKALPGMQSGDVVAWNMKPEDAAFTELARNAFEVMMRREWTAEKWDEAGNWIVVDARHLWVTRNPPQIHTDPFTALVEADKWYAANVEGVKPA